MKHFVLESPPNIEGMIRLYEKDYHYIVRVKRLKTGMCFSAILPGGEETQIRILSTADNILIGECLQTAEPGRSNSPQVVLFQGLPRGSKMDLIIRQAAESGVSLIAPFESEYSTVRISKSFIEKLKRWEKIVKEARQQSGSSIETKIRPPCNFNSLLEYWESIKKEHKQPLGILLHQEALEKEPGRNEPHKKGSFHSYLEKEPDLVALAIGPEGGFSPGEVSKFMAAGFKPLLLGNTILRTETAALFATAAIRIILLEREAWMLKPAE